MTGLFEKILNRSTMMFNRSIEHREFYRTEILNLSKRMTKLMERVVERRFQCDHFANLSERLKKFPRNSPYRYRMRKDRSKIERTENLVEELFHC